MMYFRNEVISRAGMRPLTCLLFACLPLLLLLASPAEAQVYTGSITGLIQDPSGAVVPNASVVLTDTTKGLKYSATTDSSVWCCAVCRRAHIASAWRPLGFAQRFRAASSLRLIRI